MSHYIEKEWTTAAGLKAVVLMLTEKFKEEEYLRHRCGYVAVPEGYKAWGAKLYDPRFDVHGGVTFSEESDTKSPYPVETDAHVWWIGFDCGHSGDLAPLDWEKLNNLLESDVYSPFDGIERTLGYCETECEYLARQIVELEEN